jgi:hypothetical protein
MHEQEHLKGNREVIFRVEYATAIVFDFHDFDA